MYIKTNRGIKVTKEQALSKLQLNPRLLQIAKLVPNCKAVADIGTDHGYIPIFSVLAGLCNQAIASDINKGPIKRAGENVKLFCLEEKISLRLGGGLETVEAGEADVVVIAGMGGILISDILEKSKDVVMAAKHLILQPMTAAGELREYLCQSSFNVTKEVLVAEDEKLYSIICVDVGGKCEYSPKDLLLGKNVEETEPGLFEENRKRVIQKLEKRLAGLEKSVVPENACQAQRVRELLELVNK